MCRERLPSFSEHTEGVRCAVFNGLSHMKEHFGAIFGMFGAFLAPFGQVALHLVHSAEFRLNENHYGLTISPLVDHLLVTLESRIQQGAYPNGRRLPAERALANEFGVSRMVVRSAIDALAQIGLIDRRQACRPVVRFAGGRTERPSGPGSRHTFALWLTHRPTEAEVPALLCGIQKRLDHDSCRLIVENAGGETPEAVVQSEAQFLVRLAQDRDIAGLILWYAGAQSNLPALMMLREAGIPMVFIDRRPPMGIEADHVGIDNALSAERAVKHLCDLGHRRIMLVSNLDAASTVKERSDGYRTALETSDVQFDDQLVYCATGRFTDMPATCRAIVDAAMRMPDPPTAAFCINDRIAFCTIEALRAKGLSVPQDFAVVGFDGVERWLPGPSFLTTCEQPFERMGAAAVDLLLRRIKGGPEGAYRHVLLEAPLSINGSTRFKRSEPRFLQLTQ
jgi:DNA-binding LacI/PurR family transcriptional regulator